MKCARGFFSISFILLIILLIIFHKELFAMGMRVYVSLKPDAYAERLLGNYYETAAHQNTELAKQYYTKALADLQEQIKTAPAEKQAKLKYRLGVYYECARGTTKDYTVAKKYYTEALSTMPKDGDPKLMEVIKTSIDRSDKLINNQGTPMCPDLGTFDFIRNTISGEQY